MKNTASNREFLKNLHTRVCDSAIKRINSKGTVDSVKRGEVESALNVILSKHSETIASFNFDNEALKNFIDNLAENLTARPGESTLKKYSSKEKESRWNIQKKVTGIDNKTAASQGADMVSSMYHMGNRIKKQAKEKNVNTSPIFSKGKNNRVDVNIDKDFMKRKDRLELAVQEALQSTAIKYHYTKELGKSLQQKPENNLQPKTDNNLKPKDISYEKAENLLEAVKQKMGNTYPDVQALTVEDLANRIGGKDWKSKIKNTDVRDLVLATKQGKYMPKAVEEDNLRLQKFFGSGSVKAHKDVQQWLLQTQPVEKSEQKRETPSRRVLRELLNATSPKDFDEALSQVPSPTHTEKKPASLSYEKASGLLDRAKERFVGNGAVAQLSMLDVRSRVKDRMEFQGVKGDWENHILASDLRGLIKAAAPHAVNEMIRRNNQTKEPFVSK